MSIEASPSYALAKLFNAKFIHRKKSIPCKQIFLAKHIHCKQIFLARWISWRKSIFLATCVNRGFPIICTCKNTEPTHRIALWVQETPHSSKSQKSVLKKARHEIWKARHKIWFVVLVKASPQWMELDKLNRQKQHWVSNNICQNWVLFSYQCEVIEFALKLYPYKKVTGWIPFFLLLLGRRG